MLRNRLVLLNALPLNAIQLDHFCIDVRRETIDDLRYYINKAKSINAEIISYIRHEATVNLLNQVLGLSLRPESGLYQWREGDELIIITLKKPIRGQEATEVKIEDLEFFYVYISRMCY
jgi:hypothetical protein